MECGLLVWARLHVYVRVCMGGEGARRGVLRAVSGVVVPAGPPPQGGVEGPQRRERRRY